MLRHDDESVLSLFVMVIKGLEFASFGPIVVIDGFQFMMQIRDLFIAILSSPSVHTDPDSITMFAVDFVLEPHPSNP